MAAILNQPQRVGGRHNHLDWIGRLLFEPHASIHDVVERRNVRFLSTMLFALAIVTLGGTVGAQLARNVGREGYSLVEDPLVPVGLAVGIATSVTYLLSRTAAYRTGLVLDIIFTALVPLVAAMRGRPEEATYLLYFEVMNILFASFFIHSMRWIAVVAVGDVGLVLLYGLVLQPQTVDTAGIAFQVFVVSVMVIVLTIHRRNLEAERQAQLAAINQALLHTAAESAQAAERALEADRLKSEFLATMSHELRTPMNAILGFLDVMLAGMAGEINDDAKGLLKRVQANGKRLLGLINDVLDLSKIEAGRVELLIEEYSPRDLTGELVQQMSSLAMEKGLSFNYEVDPSVPTTVRGDSEQVRKIIVNLLSNALKFTQEGSVSMIVAVAEPGQWSVAVKDTGIGIPKHALEYIFDPFRQVDGSSMRQFGGTGLGLSIVQRLVRMMDGVIRVESVEGQGSTFTVILPLDCQRGIQAGLLKEAVNELVAI